MATNIIEQDLLLDGWMDGTSWFDSIGCQVLFQLFCPYIFIDAYLIARIFPLLYNTENSNKRQRSSSTASAISNEISSPAPSSNKTALTSTSSNKRHHGTSAARKAKLDAILQDLQTTEVQLRPEYRGGSFVEPGEEERLTTNVFVGNLDPGVTEEALTDLFRQFGMSYFVSSCKFVK